MHHAIQHQQLHIFGPAGLKRHDRLAANPYRIFEPLGDNNTWTNSLGEKQLQTHISSAWTRRKSVSYFQTILFCFTNPGCCRAFKQQGAGIDRLIDWSIYWLISTLDCSINTLGYLEPLVATIALKPLITGLWWVEKCWEKQPEKGQAKIAKCQNFVTEWQIQRLPRIMLISTQNAAREEVGRRKHWGTWQSGVGDGWGGEGSGRQLEITTWLVFSCDCVMCIENTGESYKTHAPRPLGCRRHKAKYR